MTARTPSFPSPRRARRRPPSGRAGLALGAFLACGAPAPTRAQSASFVHVLHLAADDGHEYPAITLTKALETQAIREGKPRFANTNKDLTAVLREAKCGKPFVEAVRDEARALGPGSDEALDEACRQRVAVAVGAPLGPAEAYVWGYLYVERGQRWAKVHLWQRGQPDRVKALPYVNGEDERSAQRIWRHLWHPDHAADVRVTGAALGGGELYIDGASQGRVTAPAFETTLSDGDHLVEVRSPSRTLASVRVSLRAGAPAQEARLVPAAEPPPPAPSALAAPPTAPRGGDAPAGSASALPWVLGGAGVLGVAAAGVLFGLRQGAENDLEGRCATSCPPSARGDVERSNRLGTFAVVSLGAGLVAGAGALTLVLLGEAPRAGVKRASAPGRVRGSLRPLAGGSIVGLAGDF